jgi:hypothetical protein
LHYSHAVGGVCCLRCHCKAAPPASKAARRWKPPPRPAPPPPPKEDSYAWLVNRIYERLHAMTDTVIPYADGTGRILAGCPVCGTGSLTLQLLDRPPRFRFQSSRGDDVCSDGCAAEYVYEALA